MPEDEQAEGSDDRPGDDVLLPNKKERREIIRRTLIYQSRPPFTVTDITYAVLSEVGNIDWDPYDDHDDEPEWFDNKKETIRDDLEYLDENDENIYYLKSGNTYMIWFDPNIKYRGLETLQYKLTPVVGGRRRARIIAEGVILCALGFPSSFLFAYLVNVGFYEDWMIYPLGVIGFFSLLSLALLAVWVKMNEPSVTKLSK